MKHLQSAAGLLVWILVWGGGDEPESPAVMLYATKAAALDGARKNLTGCVDRKTIARVIRELGEATESTEAAAYETPGDSFMTLHAQKVDPGKPRAPRKQRAPIVPAFLAPPGCISDAQARAHNARRSG